MMKRLFLALAVLSLAGVATAQQPSAMDVTVTDQNGGIVPQALVTVLQNGRAVANKETDFLGKAHFTVTPGSYVVTTEKTGFYQAKSNPIEVAAGQIVPVQVPLQQYKEFAEQVEVLSQTSPIDIQNTANTRQLSNDEIIDIPYPTTRDYRNVLPFIPGVIQDTSGQPHINGADTRQTGAYLDGFEVSQPAAGSLQMRVSPDSIRQINVESSRYSAQYGKGSGGLLALDTSSADNRFRYSFVDFIPTLQDVHGIHFNNWTPRGSISGPIVKDKVWYYLAHESEDDLNIIPQLPAGADSSTLWRTDDLIKVSFNQGSRNTITIFALINYLDANHSGISALVPQQSSLSQNFTNYLTGLKDNLIIGGDSLLDFGFGVQRFHETDAPYGTQPFVQTPTTESGSFFEFQDSDSSRTQGFTNFFPHPFNFWGKHELSIGGEVDEVRESPFFIRRTVTDVDVNNATTRVTTFQNAPRFDLGITEESAYLQERWHLKDRLVVEGGLRVDHDNFIGGALLSPRIAGSYMIQESSETKISAGIGTYYDRSILDLLTRPMQGTRTDQFCNPVPNPPPNLPPPCGPTSVANSLINNGLPINTSFVVNRAGLRGSDFLNWSAALERKLPWNIYAKAEYLNRSGNHGFAYEPDPSRPGQYDLANHRQDRYHAASITFRKDVKPGYPIFVAYTRSAAHSSEVLDFSVDNLIFGPQIAGPLAWDAPNQAVAWGMLPLKKMRWIGQNDFAYSLIWHTGFPFVIVDQQQQLQPAEGFHRFPDFLVFNPAIEHKFTFRHYQFAVRAGIDNITNSSNPVVVNNIQGSPQFLTFSGTGHRTLNARIRLLGKK